MGEDIKSLAILASCLICGSIVLIFVCVLLTFPFNSAACKVNYVVPDATTTYDMWYGCRLEYKDGTVIPAESYRAVK